MALLPMFLSFFVRFFLLCLWYRFWGVQVGENRYEFLSHQTGVWHAPERICPTCVLDRKSHHVTQSVHVTAYVLVAVRPLREV